LSSALIAIDQGTTSTRAIAFDGGLNPLASAQRELRQIYPAPGEVEHDLEEIWDAAVATVRDCMAQADLAAKDVAGIGITNQRETCAIWDRATGRPIHHAIVWQDRRTAPLCESLRGKGCESQVTRSTGLLLDPYFSATKIAWLLDNVPGARARAENGELAFGTIDTFLLWRLTGGRVHATDATNAARTLLFDIARGEWDVDMCKLFGVPPSLLPEVRDCAAEFGTSDAALFGAPIPVRGIAGDQQAATIGHGCFKPGTIKSTYGTGAFAVLNTGETRVASRHKLLTTVAYQLGGKRTYALEGSIFVAGAAVQWLRDCLGIIQEASEAGVLAARANPAEQVYLVPAFAGLGAPYWDPQARAAIYGLTRGAGRAEIARATLESVGYQTADLLAAMRADCGFERLQVLRVDGGMTASDWTMQFLADILGSPVERPVIKETTALGAAYLAGRTAGLCPDLDGFAAQWKLDRRFEPRMPENEREQKYAGWKDAVRRTLSG
jgi:glycerol kinase